MSASPKAGLLDPFDEADHQQQRDRVVHPRLALQRAGEPLLDRRAAQHGEDRGRVGGGDRGADQHPFQQRQVEDQLRRERRRSARSAACRAVASEAAVPSTGRISASPRSARPRTGSGPARSSPASAPARRRRIRCRRSLPSRPACRGRGRAAGPGSASGRRAGRPAIPAASRIAGDQDQLGIVSAHRAEPRRPRSKGAQTFSSSIASRASSSSPEPGPGTSSGARAAGGRPSRAARRAARRRAGSRTRPGGTRRSTSGTKFQPMKAAAQSDPAGGGAPHLALGDAGLVDGDRGEVEPHPEGDQQQALAVVGELLREGDLHQLRSGDRGRRPRPAR